MVASKSDVVVSGDQDLEQLARQILTGDAEATVEDLVAILTLASDQYYNEGESFLSDPEYDTLEQQLQALDPNNLFLAQVGSDVRGGKVDLPYKMGSLDQVFEGDTQKWIKANGWEDELFVLTDKEDGTSGMILFGKGGQFQIAYSRGNGIQGADVSRHVRRMAAVPKKVEMPSAVRVEFIMEDDIFDKIKAEIFARSGREYKNARNFVAGKMNASESEDLFYDNIRVIGTSVVDPKMGKLEQLQYMEAQGFAVPHYIVKKGRELTDDFLIPYLEDRRKASKTAIDGIVIDIDSPEIRAALRRNSSSLNPMYSRKFKVGAESNKAVTEVVKVHWRVSKAGYLKPRVEIKPVDLVGVTITYATGFNAKFIKDNGIGPGARIQITRAGDVIPFIQSVIATVEPQLPDEAQYGAMDWTDGEVDLFLLDPSASPEANLYRVNDTFAKLEAPNLRLGSIEKLIAAGYDSAPKIIKATEAELKKVLGDSAGKKVFDGLKAKLNPVPFAKLAGASQTLGRGIGVRKMTKLVTALGEDLSLYTVANICKVEGFETTTANTLVKGLPYFKAFLDEIQGFYTIAAPKAKVVGGDLDGIVVVFTGVRDKDLEAKIEARGGTIGSSVNAKTTHLVCKDPSAGSSKLKKATDLGVKVIDLGEAKTLWG